MEQFQAFLEQFHTSGAADAYRYLGCHPEVREGTEGFVFLALGAAGAVGSRDGRFQLLE